MLKIQKNGLEWAVFALSLLALGLIVAALVSGRGTAGAGPPRLVVTLGAPSALPGGGVRVPVELHHGGGETVESASVDVTDGTTTATLDFGYAPRDTRLHGAAQFDRLAGPLAARVTGYTLP